MIFDEINFPELPESWTSSLVEDACDNVSVQEKTKTDKYLKSGNLAVVDQGASLIGGYINEDKSVKTDLPVIVFGDHTRAIKYIDFPFAAGADGIKVLKPKKFYQPKLFYYFLRAIKLPNKGYARHFQYLRSSQIALPPLPEQKRIAEKLDSLLARVDSCQSHLERVPQILKRFRQSVLAAATSGQLTEGWREEKGQSKENMSFDFIDTDCFGDYEFPKTWTIQRLKDIADVIGGITKDSKKQNMDDEELPYLRVANVQRGYLDLTEMKTIRVPKQKLNALLLKPGDVLFNEGGDIDKLGRGWIWNGEIERCIFQNHVFRARLKDSNFAPKYFSHYGNSRGYDYFLAYGKQTTNLASINKTIIESLPVAVPPIEEQAEIVRRVEKLFAYAAKLEARYQSASEQVARLTPSLLAKAFRGELVGQDPNDESASALVERIRETRDAQKAGPSVKSKKSKRS